MLVRLLPTGFYQLWNVEILLRTIFIHVWTPAAALRPLVSLLRLLQCARNPAEIVAPALFISNSGLSTICFSLLLSF